jgi:hypothetical protein
MAQRAGEDKCRGRARWDLKKKVGKGEEERKEEELKETGEKREDGASVGRSQ